jgi:hypothetical protein
MLEITASGHKLLPLVIFRRKSLPKDKFLPGIIVSFEERLWMTEELILRWLNVGGKRCWASCYARVAC